MSELIQSYVRTNLIRILVHFRLIMGDFRYDVVSVNVCYSDGDDSYHMESMRKQATNCVEKYEN